MRVISGEAKGRKLSAPESGLRPLSDRAKEALFNIIAAKIPGSRFLDLFAGSGAVGIEALSRGAASAIFVERSRLTVRYIHDNLKHTRLSEYAEVFSLEVARALKILNSKGAKFDIIYVGAPYGCADFLITLDYLGKTALLEKDGIVIAEHRSRELLPDSFGVIRKYRENKQGDTMFSFFRVAGEIVD